MTDTEEIPVTPDEHDYLELTSRRHALLDALINHDAQVIAKQARIADAYRRSAEWWRTECGRRQDVAVAHYEALFAQQGNALVEIYRKQNAESDLLRAEIVRLQSDLAETKRQAGVVHNANRTAEERVAGANRSAARYKRKAAAANRRADRLEGVLTRVRDVQRRGHYSVKAYRSALGVALGHAADPTVDTGQYMSSPLLIELPNIQMNRGSVQFPPVEEPAITMPLKAYESLVVRIEKLEGKQP